MVPIIQKIKTSAHIHVGWISELTSIKWGKKKERERHPEMSTSSLNEKRERKH